MPENEFPKLRPHPAKTLPSVEVATSSAPSLPPPPPPPPWAQVAVTSNYTFLRGGSHPEELVQQAAGLQYRAVALTDHNTLAGIVRAHVAAKQCGIQLMVGSRIVLSHPHNPPHPRHSPTTLPDVLLFATSMEGYRALCRFLTLGKRRAPKGECHLYLDDLQALSQQTTHLLAVLIPPPAEHHPHPHNNAILTDPLRRIVDWFAQYCYLAMSPTYDGADAARMHSIHAAAAGLGVPLLATLDVLYHIPRRRMLQDILTCIRRGCTISQAGFALEANAQRFLHSPHDLHRVFAAYPSAIAATIEVATRTAGFSLDQLRYEYPSEVVPQGTTPIDHLSRLTWEGAAQRYAHHPHAATTPASPDVPLPPSLSADLITAALAPSKCVHQADAYSNLNVYGQDAHIPPEGISTRIPPSVVRQIQHELALIHDLHYESYFLTVHDLVVFAVSRGIVCQGRGAAANSAVCYCLGVTAVDPSRVSMLFERFISKERNEPPDIDIDFEHERREEVIQYIYQKYGRERAALTAEVISYRRRSAVRDVGKALGLSLDLVDRLAKDIEWWDGGGHPGRDGGGGLISRESFRKFGLNPDDVTLQHLVTLVGEILGFPRHLSQHVGGFVITQSPLCELCPIENASMPDRTVIEWDKDDVDAAGMLKVDVLGLGMLTAVSKCMAMVNATTPPQQGPLTLATIPPEDPSVYDMICKADTVGVFQIESRAQMSMLPRLKPRCYYDLVIEVAIVRPGPIQGDMVHPYLRRRNGEEPTTYPDEAVQRVLGRTLGVPLFQEQCMALAIACAGFTAGEADQLRRAMAAWKRKSDIIYRFGQKILEGMTQRGYQREFAEKVFAQIKGFSEYGFPESHAASFALVVYTSAYLKHYYPAAFAASLINSQPMGFYAPAQLIRDAQSHGVRVLPVDCNLSQWDCTLHAGALRLGMRLVKGLSESSALLITKAVRERGHFATIQTLWRTSGVSIVALRRLAAADAFGSMGIDRQKALWRLQGLNDAPLPLFDLAERERSQSHAPTPSVMLHSEPVRLPTMAPAALVVSDYASMGLSLKAHPLSFLRAGLERMGVVRSRDLSDPLRLANHDRIAVAGLVLVRQRPATASGVVFITLEDESGIANLIVRPKIYDRYRRAARHSAVVVAHGRLERKNGVVHVLVSRISALDDQMAQIAQLVVQQRNFH